MSKCNDCAYCTPEAACLINKQHMNPNGTACQLFKSKNSVCYCDICNSAIINPIIYQTDTEQKFVCSDCANKSGTCGLCEQRFQCDFETNPSSMPKTVIQQVRRGPAVMQTEVRNPERIKITCENCVCWDKEEKYCLREYGTCGRYKLCFGL